MEIRVSEPCRTTTTMIMMTAVACMCMSWGGRRRIRESRFFHFPNTVSGEAYSGEENKIRRLRWFANGEQIRRIWPRDRADARVFITRYPKKRRERRRRVTVIKLHVILRKTERKLRDGTLETGSGLQTFSRLTRSLNGQKVPS